MTSEPDRLAPGRPKRSRLAKATRDREGAEGVRRGSVGAGDSLWSTIRHRWFDASEWHLRLAGFHGRSGRTNSAEASYRKVLSRHPDRLGALVGLGRLLLRGRRYDEAVEICQRAVAVEPEAAAPAFQLARALHRSGQVERAAVQYLRVVASQPTHDKAVAALEEIGRRLVRADASVPDAEGVAAAAEIGRQLLAFSPAGERARGGAVAIASAISASASGLAPRAPEVALARFEAALSVIPDSLEALSGAADCFERLGRLDSALAALDRLIELSPRMIEPQFRRERIRTALEGSDGAKAAAAPDAGERRALLARAQRLFRPEEATPGATLDPQERTALVARAQSLLRPDGAAPGTPSGPQERRALLTRAQRLLRPEGAAPNASSGSQDRTALLAWAHRLEAPKPGTPEAALGSKEREALLARVLRLLGPEKSAAAARLDPREPEALPAGAQHHTGPEEAAPEGRVELRESSPSERLANQISLDLLLQQARAAQQEDKLVDAETIFQQILHADNRNTRALSGLSRLCMSQRRWADAVAHLTRLTMYQPASIEPKKMLAQALYESGRLDAAQRAYAELAALEPDNLMVWRSLGRVYGRLGDWTSAREAWSLVTELDPESLQSRLELAEACHRAGDVDAARAELQWVLAREPDHRRALTQLARIQRIPDPEASLSCWLRLADLDPAALEPPLQMARIHLRLQRLDKAEVDFRAVLDRNPTHGEALASLVKILEQHDPEAAIRWLAHWSELEPTAVGPWLAKGRLHVGAKQSELAEAAFHRAVELAPSNVEALTGLGRFYMINGRLDEALELWSKLQELSADLREPKLQIARILYDRRDPGAVEVLLQVLKIDPQHQEALRRLTQALRRHAGAGERALEIWDQVEGVERDSVRAILLRALLLEQIGRFAEAEIEYRLALALDEWDRAALTSFATFLTGQQQWKEAIEVHRTRLLLEPERADILLEIGQNFNRLDELEEARESYDQALALEPDNITALGYRGRLLRTLGQVDASIAAFHRICELDPRNAQAWRELVFYLAGAERETEALATLDEAEAALGKTPETWVALGGAAAAALFESRAVAYYERAIAAQPENATYHAQLGLHYLRQGVPDGAFHHLLDSRNRNPGNVEVAKGLFDTTRLLRELGYDHVAMRQGARTVGEILVPERLFAHVRRIAETRVTPYKSVPRSVVAISATLAPGGAERQLVNMLRGLSDPAFGLDLALFCINLSSRSRRDFFLPILDGTGVDVVVPDPAATNDYLWDPEVAPFAEVIRPFPADMVAAIAFWLQEFRRRRPQVVHAWQDTTNLSAVVAALLAGVPRIILCCRSIRPDNPRRRLRRFMREAYRAVLDHPAVVLSNNSRAGANDYAEWLELEPERIEVVYNGIDFDQIDSGVDLEETARARQALGIPPDVQILGGVYRMSEEKRPLLWLDVAAAVARQNDTAHFVVCGDGPMRDEMRNYASTLGIADRVHMPGAQSNIGSWYKMMDVVMLTSRHEGLPNVLLEAQSLGIPVVAPDVGGMSEVVEQGITGWTIRNADANSLAERVLHCLTDEAWRQVAAERAPRFVRDRFGVATMLRRNLEVYGIPAGTVDV